MADTLFLASAAGLFLMGTLFGHLVTRVAMGEGGEITAEDRLDSEENRR